MHPVDLIRSALARRPLRLAALFVLALVALAALGGSPARPAPVRAGGVQGPVDIGTSFSPERAEALGLDYQSAFERVLQMRFAVVRVSAYWSQVDSDGWARTDWLMAEAAAHGQPIVLSVGAKGIGWPEYYIPSGMEPRGVPDGADISADHLTIDGAAAFITEAVVRYRDNPALYAWQVENEPFNQAGPHHWWIGRRMVAGEVALVKRLDKRPVVVNAFGRFNMAVDRGSGHSGLDLGSLFGFDADGAEKDSLRVLSSGDIFGLDVYTAIGYRFLGGEHVTHAASDWAPEAGRWITAARSGGRRAWVTEAQAEPWEPGSPAVAHPVSTSPREMTRLFYGLKAEGYSTVLLWGSEYWLWRADHGDPTWLDAVGQLQHREAPAAEVTHPPHLA